MVPFVGREREQALLIDAWQRAQAGTPSYVLVHGEAGVGKTRLVDEISGRVRAGGAWVLRGRSWDLGGAPAYWPWIQAFGALIDEAGEATLAPLLDELDPALLPALLRLLPRLRAFLPPPLAREDVSREAAEERLWHAVPALLRRVSAWRPLLLVLDDLEAADLPSLLLLGSLARAGGGAAQLLLIAVHRTPVLLETAAAAALNRLSAEPAVTQLRLGGLDRAEIGQMIVAMTGRPVDEHVAAGMHARTGGSPLFASELIRLMASELAGTSGSAGASDLPSAWPLPSGTRGVIEQRLSRLPADCRKLLAAAAVGGREVDLDVLAAVADRDTADVLAALRPAVASAELVTIPERPRAYAFAHPLIRECLYEGLSTVTRADLHGCFGDALRAHHAGAVDEHLDVIASHYVAALPVGWAPQALELARRAARRAAGLGARDECVRLLLLAREALAEIDEGGAIWCELTLELAEAQDRAGQTLNARATFMQVAERAEAVGLLSAFARAAVAYGGRFIWARPTGDPREIPMLERAYAALGTDEPALRALLLARKSILRRDLAGADAIVAGCRQAAELARAADDATARAQVLGALVYAIGCFGTTEECLRAIDELAATAAASGDAEQTVQAHVYRAACLLEDGNAAGADAELAACDRLEQSLRQPVQRWLREFSHGEVAGFRGQLTEAESRSEEALRIGRALGRQEGAAIYLASIYLLRREQGRLTELEALVEQARADLPTFAIARCLPGHLDGELGRLGEAKAFLDRHLESGFAELLESSTHRMVLGLLAETAAHTGHAAAAAALEPLLAPVTRRYLSIPGAVVLGPTRRSRGLLAAAAGAWKEAAELLREAAEESRRDGADCWAARCELELAQALLAGGAGDPREARALLAAVTARADANGFADVAARARRVEARLEENPGAAASRPPTLQREGELWTIAYAGTSVQVRDLKGLRYLAALLAHPGEELSVVSLASGDAGAEGTESEEDRSGIEQRLDALREEIEESARWNDLARGERARREWEELEAELAATLGLGGRDRRTGTPVARARYSVTKAIRNAVRLIAREHAVLGRHLETTVRTGLYCRYQPDPLLPPRWRVQS
jgi:hypothetical protein